MLLWEKYGIGLPVCIVSDLEIDQARNKIRISTFGRGLWEIDGMDPNFLIPEDEVMNYINIFPNPTNSEIHVRSSVFGARSSVLGVRSSVFIFDMFGRQLEEIQVPIGQDQVSIDVSDYPAGIYIAVLKNEKGNVGRRKFVVK
jgi:hypothetical protein